MGKRKDRAADRILDTRRKDSVADQIFDTRDTTVLDSIDRMLHRGVLADGDVTLGLAGVDLIYLRLTTLLCGATRVFPRPAVPLSRPIRRRHPRRLKIGR
jgi:Gas vesicle protein